MPDYKRKKVRHFGTKHPKKVQPTARESIRMRPSGQKEKDTAREEPVRVIKGKRLERRRRFRITAAAAILIVIALCVLSAVLPAGLADNVANLTAQIGPGKYPMEFFGSTVNSEQSGYGYQYVLSDTQLTAFANQGKLIFHRSHGFANPVLRVSATRSLSYDQGGTAFTVSNLKKITAESTTGFPILCGDISRSGVYAVATGSDTNAAVVSVYGKNNKLLYEWHSATDSVTNVSVSASGKQIAVSLLNVAKGQFTSKVVILGYDSADAIHTVDYGTKPVLSLESADKGGFFALTSNQCDYIRWSDAGRSTYASERELVMQRSSAGGLLLVFHRAGSQTDNHIVWLSSKGQKQAEFDFTGDLGDIALHHGHIYCISGTTVSMLDKEGKVLRTASCGYGGERIAVTGTYSVAVISSTGIERVEFKEEKE